MTEDRRDRPSRGWPDDGSGSSAPRSGYPEWPPRGDSADDDAAPTDVYAALSELAPHDSGLGEEVPRDFAPPQGSWSQDPGVGASRIRLTRTPPPLDPDTSPGMYGRPPSASGSGPLAPPDNRGGPYGTPSSDLADYYGRPAAASGSEPYGRPADPYGRSPADGGSEPAEPYGRPADLYGRSPADGGSEPAEPFDRPWTLPADDAASHGDSAAGHRSREAAYGDQSEGYGEGATGYDGPAAGYGSPDAGFGGAGADYGDAAATHGGAAAGYEGLGAGFGDPAATYSGQAAGYDGRGVDFGDPAATYSGPAAGYGSPAAGSGDLATTYSGPGAGLGAAPWTAAGGTAAGGRAAAGMYDGPPRVEWVTADETVVGAEPVIDLSVARAAPVTHRGRNRRRRGIVVAAALGAVLAGGTGYAALRGLGLGGGTTHKNAEVPLVTLAPTSDPALPDDSPSISIPDSASAAVSKTASASPSVSPSTAPTTRATTPANGPASSGVVVIPTPAPTVTNSAHAIKPSPPATSPAGSAAPLTARFSQVGNDSGYVGTVTVTNPGGTAADGWTVQVTAPGADQVVVLSGGVSARLAGDVLTFSGPSIGAGGSLTYTFGVAGPLSGPLSGCSINGNACS